MPTAYRGRPNALPFRAYNLIYNEYFRDQNLQEPVEVPMNDGSDKADTYRLLRVCWKKDYFTSALPWTQRGQEVDLPSLVRLRQFDELDQDSPFQKLVVPIPPNNVWEPAQWIKSGSGVSPNMGVLRNLDPSNIGDVQSGSSGGGALGYNSVQAASAENTRTAFAWLIQIRH